MDKEAAVHIYIMEYYPAIKRNTFESVLMRWMNLEPVTQREISQKNISYINTYMDSRRMVMTNLFAEQQWRHRHREHTYEQGWGIRGGG